MGYFLNSSVVRVPCVHSFMVQTCLSTSPTHSLAAAQLHRKFSGMHQKVGPDWSSQCQLFSVTIDCRSINLNHNNHFLVQLVKIVGPVIGTFDPTLTCSNQSWFITINHCLAPCSQKSCFSNRILRSITRVTFCPDHRVGPRQPERKHVHDSQFYDRN